MTRLALVIFALLTMLGCSKPDSAQTAAPMDSDPVSKTPAATEVATLGGGCYWCLEAAYRQLDGIVSVTSGFMGGHVEHPTYQQVCDGDTGHAEVVHLVFDPQQITYERILAWFWDLHDPTTLNRQGNDVGTQYRSVIFYHDVDQQRIANASKAAVSKQFDDPIVTEIVPASVFFLAPQDHQNYYFRNKSRNPYCRFVIEPKLHKLKLDH
jgi:peptide-methionine (S)-S-oxide reductase